MSEPARIIFNILNHPDRIEELMAATGRTREEIEALLTKMSEDRQNTPANFTYRNKDENN